jgi:hypothetical protein
MGEHLAFFLLALVAVIILYGVAAHARKRREDLRALAEALGLRFDPAGDRSYHPMYAHSIFRKGKSRKTSNTIWGVMAVGRYPIEVRMGDYRYVTGSGRSRQTHRISYALFRLPFFGTPDLLIRKEGLGDKILGGLGFDDIDFESEAFSRRFWVKSEDKRYAYDVIHPRMMEFFLEGPTPQIEIVNDACLILEGTRHWDPLAFRRATVWFTDFLALWPEHLLEDLRFRNRELL